MPLLRKFLNLLRRRRLEQDMAEEMRLHHEHRVDQAMAEGLDRASAERRARLQFGPAEAVKEAARETRFFTGLEQLCQDLGYAGRSLRRSPGFAAVTLLTFTVGIGCNTACFSLLNSLLLRPFAYPHAERIVFLSESPPGAIGSGSSGAALARWHEDSVLFEHLGGYHSRRATLTGREHPRPVSLT